MDNNIFIKTTIQDFDEYILIDVTIITENSEKYLGQIKGDIFNIFCSVYDILVLEIYNDKIRVACLFVDEIEMKGTSCNKCCVTYDESVN